LDILCPAGISGRDTMKIAGALGYPKQQQEGGNPEDARPAF